MAVHARSMASPLARMVRFSGAFEGARAGVDRCRARGIQKSPALSRTPRPLARLAVDASPQGSGGGPRPRPLPRTASSPRFGVQRARSPVAMAALAQKHVQGAQRRPGAFGGQPCRPLRLGRARGVAPEFRVDHRGRGGWETPKPGVGERGGPCAVLVVRRSAAPGVGAVGQVGRAGAPRRVGPPPGQQGRGRVFAVPPSESVVGVPRLFWKSPIQPGKRRASVLGR